MAVRRFCCLPCGAGWRQCAPNSSLAPNGCPLGRGVEGAKMSEANVIGVGGVGCGGKGLRHAELYHSMKEARLIGVCDVEREKAEAVAARFGVKAFTHVEDLVSEK